MIINYRRLVLAYLIEGGVVATSLFAAIIFALNYGQDDKTMIGMMVAPIIYALIELARVPLAGVVRTADSYLIKFIALIAIIAAAGLTAKSVSQMGEMQFRPRLEDVNHKKSLRDQAKAELDAVSGRISQLSDLVQSRQDDLQRLNSQISNITTERTVTATRAKPYQVRLADGRLVWRTPPDNGVSRNLNDRASKLVLEQQGLQTELEKTRAELSSLSRENAEKSLASAQTDYAKSIQNSQLHHFAGMIFGLDPADMTDDKIALVMRVFVFIPAIFAGIIATVLALSAYSRPRSLKTGNPLTRSIRALIARRRKQIVFQKNEKENLQNYIHRTMTEIIEDAQRDQTNTFDHSKKVA